MVTCRLLLVACLGLLAGSAAFANGWQTACDDGLCVFRHDVPAPGGRGTSALFEILIDAETVDTSVVLTTPLGVALEPGVRLIAGNREWRAPIKVCHGDGCRATMTLDEDDLGYLMAEPEAVIEYYVFGSDAAAALRLPLTGLVSAITSQSR